MTRVLYVSYPISKKVFGKADVKVELIDKEVDELTGGKLDWVTKSLNLMKSPTGVELKPCAWHSGCPLNENDTDDPKRCHLENPPDFGIWMTNYNVFDTCHIQIKMDKDKEQKDINRMENMCNSYTKWFNFAIEAHTEFKNNIVKRNTTLETLSLLKKKIAENSKEPDVTNSKYMTLIQLKDMKETSLKKKIENLTTTYQNSKNTTVSLEDFLKRHAQTETLDFQKASDSVLAWYNSNKSKDLPDLKSKYETANNVLAQLEHTLTKNYKIPFTYIYRAKKNLEEMNFYYKRYKIKRDYTRDDIKFDIVSLDGMLSEYEKYLDGKTPQSIVEEVEKEQEIVNRQERENKSGKNVHRVISDNAPVAIVMKDGTIRYENVKEKVIMGAVNGGTWKENETQRWGDLRK